MKEQVFTKDKILEVPKSNKGKSKKNLEIKLYKGKLNNIIDLIL